MKKITVVGPESTGKSTLCRGLAQHYGEPWVREYARKFLTDLGGPYGEEDLLKIAKGQCELEDEVALNAKHILLCDTDMITIRIWSEEVFMKAAPELIQLSEERQYDLWLLCTPEMPWEPDPLRENPDDRDRLFTRYAGTLKTLGKRFVVLSGSHDERMRIATEVTDELCSEE